MRTPLSRAPRQRDAADRIVYDHGTGNLFYDADGTGVQSQTLFATLTNKPVLNSGEFQVV